MKKHRKRRVKIPEEILILCHIATGTNPDFLDTDFNFSADPFENSTNFFYHFTMLDDSHVIALATVGRWELQHQAKHS